MVLPRAIQNRELGGFHLARRPPRHELFQIFAPGVRHFVLSLVPDFRFRRQQSAKRFPYRGNVIPAHPLPKFDELRPKRRQRIENLLNLLHARIGRRFPARSDSNANHFLVAKRNNHSPSDKFFGFKLGRRRVGEQRAERYGQRNFAIAGGHDEALV